MRGNQAKALNLQTLSQLGKASPNLRLVSVQNLTREDGLAGITLRHKFREQPKGLLLGLLYEALQQKQVDVIAGSTTDGLIKSLGLVDPSKMTKTISRPRSSSGGAIANFGKIPRIGPESSAELGGKISEEDMRKLNYRELDGNSRKRDKWRGSFLQQNLAVLSPQRKVIGSFSPKSSLYMRKLLRI